MSNITQRNQNCQIDVDIDVNVDVDVDVDIKVNINITPYLRIRFQTLHCPIRLEPLPTIAGNVCDVKTVIADNYEA